MLNTCSSNYPKEISFQQEALQVGGGSIFLGPYLEQKFSSEVLSEQDMENFANRRNGDGSHMLRQQSNAAKNIYCYVLGMTRSCNAMLLTELRDLPKDQAILRVKDASECIKTAMVKTYEETLSKVMVGRGAQRKIVEEADRLAVLSIHGMNNLGQYHGHGHLFFHGCGYLQSQKRSYSVADGRDVYRIQDIVTTLFHQHLESQLSTKMGWAVSRDKDGHTQALGYDERIYEQMTGGGRERIEQYLRDNNLPSTPVTRAYAALNVRENGERPFYDLSESVERWQGQARELKQAPMFAEDENKRPPAEQKATKEPLREPEKARPMTAFLAREAMFGRIVREGFKAVDRAVRVKFESGKAVVQVRDVNRFLLDTQKRPKREAHREAFNAMKKSQWLGTSPVKTLKLGELAYKQARKPRLELKPGDKIKLSKTALEGLTKEQSKQIEAVARKYGVKVNLPEQKKPKQQITRAEQLRLLRASQEYQR